MVTRLYVDNFKTLSNFTLELGPIRLLIGRNGTGKSSVLEVLGGLRRFVVGREDVGDVFRSTSRTRWDKRQAQRFELDLEGGGETFRYVLEVSHDLPRGGCRVYRESLHSGTGPLYEAGLGEGDLFQARLFRDDHSEGPQLLSDGIRSGVGVLQARHDNLKIARFRELIAAIQIAMPDPWSMEDSSEREEPELSKGLANFASWFRHVSQEFPGRLESVFRDLRQVIPGFSELRLTQAGESTRVLKMEFRSGESRYSLDWLELSEGQRLLVCLYSLLHWSAGPNQTLLLDEPENFLALGEIQPWTAALIDRVCEEGGQVILLSHHPEILDYMTPDRVTVLTRDRGGPTVVRPWRPEETGLTPSELVARGWES